MSADPVPSPAPPATSRPAYTLSSSRSAASNSARRASRYAGLLTSLDPSRATFAVDQLVLATEAALMASDAEHYRDWSGVRTYTSQARRAEQGLRLAYALAKADARRRAVA